MNELEAFKQADWVEPENRFVFWSGGKDSTVALHLTLRAWSGQYSPKVVFIDTGITLPETLEYISRLAEEWSLDLTILKPEIDFWEYVKKIAGFPIVKARWCLRLLKMEPIKKFLYKHHGWKVQVLGIRKEESPARQKHPFYQRSFSRHTKLKFTYNLYPLLNWTRDQIGSYHKKHSILLNAASKIYGSTGCYFCPFIRSPQHYLALKNRHPALFQKIVEAEKTRFPSTAWPEKSIIPLSEQQLLPVSRNVL